MKSIGIAELEELTSRLPSLDKIIGPNMVQYPVKEGTCFGFGLYNVQDIAVMRVFLSAGTPLPIRFHPHKKEWAILYKGSIEYRCKDNGEIKILKAGDSIALGKYQVYEDAIAKRDTELIAIIIPTDKSYPNVEKTE